MNAIETPAPPQPPRTVDTRATSSDAIPLLETDAFDREHQRPPAQTLPVRPTSSPDAPNRWRRACGDTHVIVPGFTILLYQLIRMLLCGTGPTEARLPLPRRLGVYAMFLVLAPVALIVDLPATAAYPLRLSVNAFQNKQ